MPQKRMSAEEYRKTVKEGKPSKYRNKRTEYNGVVYDSMAEADYAARLDLEKKSGLIAGWTRQVPFYLGCMENKMVVDFLVFHPLGVYAVEIKGFETSKFRRDKKLWERHAPCELEIRYKDKLIIIKNK